MALEQTFKLQFLILVIAVYYNNGLDVADTKENFNKIVKKAQPPDVNLTQQSPVQIGFKDHDSALPNDVIGEKKKVHGSNTSIFPQPVTSNVITKNQVEVEETNFKNNDFHRDDEIPDSFQTGFYLFLGLSSAAVIFIVVKVYRLRLSRAERKYGVQGDRTTQELTPLPISIEDGNSDDDDQTLFELNRQQIRIL